MSASGNIPQTILDLPVERLQQEVWAWRQDAAARLQMMMAGIKGALAKGEETRAIDIEVNFLRPSATALSAYMAGDLDDERCDACGKPLLAGERVWTMEDGGEMHAACIGETLPREAFAEDPGHKPEPHVFQPYYTDAKVREIAEAARAFLQRDEVEG